MPDIWLLLVLLARAIALGSGSWSYEGSDGPDTWSTTYPTCGGNEQSPIDLSTCSNRTFPGFSGSVFGTAPSVASVLLQNSGSSVLLTALSNVTVSGGGLNGTYSLASVHFHWGNSSDRGSEHTVSGRRYPMELHMVTYNSYFSSLDAALSTGDRQAVAVLGVFIQVEGSSSGTSNAFDVLLGALPNVSYPGNSTMISLPMKDLANAFQSILSNSLFYRYLGSLTTPTCDQKVIWTVFKDTLGVMESQLTAFRKLTSSNGQPLVDNYRPIQNINRRTVYCSIQSSTATLRSGGRGPSLVQLALTAVAFLQMPLSSLVAFD